MAIARTSSQAQVSRAPIACTRRAAPDDPQALSEERMWALLEHAGDFFAVVDAAGQFLYVTATSARLLGLTERDLIGTSFLEVMVSTEVARARRQWAEMLANPGAFVRDDYQIEVPSGRTVWLDVMASNLLADPGVAGVLITARDITERRASERASRDLTRVLSTVNAVNETMIRAHDAPSVARSMCRTLVEQGGYRYAAIVARGERAPDLAAVAAAGEGLDYLASAPADPSRPLWLAVTERSAQVVNDVAATPPTPWRAECLRRGFNSVVALPIDLEDGTPGALGIASARRGEFDCNEVSLLQRLAADLSFALSMQRTRRERDVAGHRAELALEAVTQTLSKALEWRDPYTAGHERRVAELCGALGRELNLDRDVLRGIEVAAGIHDIGKIAVPAEILSHPGVLNSAQRELLRAHCQIGHDIIGHTDFPWPVADMVLQHHERLDGSGYPNGLVGDQIALGARIIAVADVVEAMAAHRPYRPAHPLPDAVDHIVEQRGVLYDADVADALQVIFADGRLEAICGRSGPAGGGQS